MKRKLLGVGILLLVIVSISACNLNFDTDPQEDTAVFIKPFDGQQIYIDQDVEVQTKILSRQPVTAIELLVNGELIRSDQLQNPKRALDVYQIWKPDLPGTYELHARITAGSGKFVSNSIQIIVSERVNSDSVTITPSPTSEIITPTVTLTMTPDPDQEVIVTGTLVLNCRQGPSYQSPTLDGLGDGQTAIATAINPQATWVQVIGPNDRYIQCWVPLEYLIVDGDLGTVLVLDPPIITVTPTKTPNTPTVTPTSSGGQTGPTEP